MNIRDQSQPAFSSRLPKIAVFATVVLVGLGLTLGIAIPSTTNEIADGGTLFQNLVWLCAGSCLSLACLANPNVQRQSKNLTFWIAIFCGAMLLALVTFSTLYAGPNANFRSAVNTLWQWLGSGVALGTLIGLFRSNGLSDLTPQKISRACLWFVIFASWALALHGGYQKLVSFQNDIRLYQKDPESVLRESGIDAPEGSAMRNLFESRLLDRAPMATFALTNSLAIVLAVALVLLCGVLVNSNDSSIALRSSIFFIVVLPLAMCLIWTKSRTAWLASLAGIAWIILHEQNLRALARQTPIKTALGVFCLAGIVLSAVYWWDPLIVSESAKSLFFRASYWQTTLTIMADHPLLGIGVGNFQDYYTQYKPSLSSEAVSDPHSLWFETLAVAGPLSLVLLICFLVTTVFYNWQSGFATNDISGSSMLAGIEQPQGSYKTSVAFVSGIMLACGCIWLTYGLAGAAPDWLPYSFLIPVSMIVFYIFVVKYTDDPSSFLFTRPTIVAALITSLVALSFAGGWMTPGVGNIVLILLAQLLAFGPSSKLDEELAILRPQRLAWCILTLGLLCCFIWSAWLPTRKTELLLLQLQQPGARFDDVTAANIVASDRWNPYVWRLAGAAEHNRILGLVSNAGSEISPTLLERFDYWSDGYVRSDQQSWEAWTQRGHWRQDLAAYDPQVLTLAAKDYEMAVERYPSDVEVLLQAAIAHFMIGEYEGADEFLTKAEEVDRFTEHLDRKLAAGIVYWSPFLLRNFSAGGQNGVQTAINSKNKELWENGREPLGGQQGWVRAEPLAQALRRSIAQIR